MLIPSHKLTQGEMKTCSATDQFRSGEDSHCLTYLSFPHKVFGDDPTKSG